MRESLLQFGSNFGLSISRCCGISCESIQRRSNSLIGQTNVIRQPDKLGLSQGLRRDCAAREQRAIISSTLFSPLHNISHSGQEAPIGLSGESCVVNPGSAATTRDWPNSAQLGLHPCILSRAEALNRDGIVRRGAQIEAQALLCLDGEQTNKL